MKRWVGLGLFSLLGACGPAQLASSGGEREEGSDEAGSSEGEPGDGDSSESDGEPSEEDTAATESTDTGEPEPSVPDLPAIECETLEVIDDSVTIDEHSTLADFAALVCVEEITGILQVEHPQIDHLGFLVNLRRVGEGFRITGNLALTSLADLHGLVEVGGSLMITDNPGLLDLDGLGSVSSLGGLGISSNEALASLAGFDGALHFTGTSIYSASVRFSIVDNPSLTSLDGLAGITSVTSDVPLRMTISNNEQLGGDLVGLSGWISDANLSQLTVWNNSLASLEGLEGLSTLDRLHLFGPAGDFVSLAGLDNLTSVTESLAIGACLCGLEPFDRYDYRLTSIESLDGLESLVSVGSLTIWGNEALTNIDALANLETATWVTIAQNPLLPEAAVASMLAGVDVAESLETYKNGTGEAPICSCLPLPP